jgi:hypothetical protein
MGKREKRIYLEADVQQASGSCLAAVVTAL